jgi:hypothetical protein
MKLTCGWNTLLTAYIAHWCQKSKSVSLDHNGGRPILSYDKFIFSRTISSNTFGKQRAKAVHTSQLLLQRRFFNSFFCNFLSHFFFFLEKKDRSHTFKWRTYSYVHIDNLIVWSGWDGSVMLTPTVPSQIKLSNFISIYHIPSSEPTGFHSRYTTIQPVGAYAWYPSYLRIIHE